MASPKAIRALKSLFMEKLYIHLCFGFCGKQNIYLNEILVEFFGKYSIRMEFDTFNVEHEVKSTPHDRLH